MDSLISVYTGMSQKSEAIVAKGAHTVHRVLQHEITLTPSALLL